jgi:hypothetical protein
MKKSTVFFVLAVLFIGIGIIGAFSPDETTGKSEFRNDPAGTTPALIFCLALGAFFIYKGSSSKKLEKTIPLAMKIFNRDGRIDPQEISTELNIAQEKVEAIIIKAQFKGTLPKAKNSEQGEKKKEPSRNTKDNESEQQTENKFQKINSLLKGD